MPNIYTKLVAEIGICHRGSLGEALKMITLAAGAKCDAVKFQVRNPELSIPKDQWNVIKETPFWAEKSMPYIDYKKRLEFSTNDYRIINQHCLNVGIDWSVSVWDIPTLKSFTKIYNLPWLKIPSAHCTSDKLVIAACQWAKNNNRHVLISTGMSTETQVDHTYNIAKSILKEKTSSLLVLMYCHSAYPTPLNELNLTCINTMREKYDCLIGSSCHETTIISSCASILYGVQFLEKHITLNRDGGCTDDFCALAPTGLVKWVQGCTDLETAMIGNGQITLYDSELPFQKKLRG